MTLHEKIRKTLLDRLMMMRPGERFASGPSLSREFDVAPMTINKVITELVREGRLICERGRGTFVADLPSRNRVITFLLPCSGFLTAPSAHLVRALAAGVTDEAQKRGMRVEYLAVSPTNRMDDIDFKVLDHLDETSMVVVPFTWFYAVFPFLVERRCRVAFIDRQQRENWPNCECTKLFGLVDFDVESAVIASVKRLYDRGCRRIGLLSYYREDDPPQYPGYRRAMAESGLPELIFDRSPDCMAITSEERHKLEQSGCDALIFDAAMCIGLNAVSLSDAVGIPEHMLWETYRYVPELNFIRNVPGNFTFDTAAAGEAAVALFTAKPMTKRIFSLDYFQPQTIEQQERIVV